MPPMTCSNEFKQSDDNEPIDVDFLLPNGVLITLNLSKELTLADVKDLLFKEILNDELNQQVPIANFFFTSVNEDAEYVQFYDYTKKLSELKLFQEYPFFKLVESEGDFGEKLLNSELSNAIGINIDEIELIKDEELLQYRLELVRLIRVRLIEENKINSIQDNQALFDCVYAPNLEIDPTQLELKKMNDYNLISLSASLSSSSSSISSTIDRSFFELTLSSIEIRIFEVKMFTSSETVELTIPLNFTPKEIIEEYLAIREAMDSNDDLINTINKDSLVLSLCGSDEIFYGDKHKIVSYKYIQKCLSINKKPTFFINTKEKLRAQLKKSSGSLLIAIENLICELQNRLQITLNKQYDVKNSYLSWDSEHNFSIYLDYLAYFPLSKDYDKVFIKMAIFHGQEQVGQEIESDRVDSDKIEEFHFIAFNELIQFDVRISQLHRCAKLCLFLNYISKRRKEVCTIGWVSLNIFDYKSQIISGKRNIYLWPSTQKSFLSFCQSTVTGQNPNKEFSLLKVEFLKDIVQNKFYYPSKEQSIALSIHSSTAYVQDECLDVSYASENDNTLLETILYKDPLAELTEQDKSVLWIRKADCLKYPNSLPKLLQTVKWSNKDDVVEIYFLLNDWPCIKPAVAIELLSSNYFDVEVRNFAVKCLDKFMKNEDVQNYLIQLVQAIKNEPYFDNQLTKFLLNRAFQSQRLGFDLFWNLKSEIKNPKYKHKFGFILEAYCRGIGCQLKDLLKQIESIENLSSLCVKIKSNKDNINLIKSSFLKDTFDNPDNKSALSNLMNPLNRSQILGDIESHKCRILSSAKRPLYLSWKNSTNYGDLFESNYDLIFKHGDDLRQDMLTIQILKLMNTIWKNEGLDLSMLLYDCISTGHKIGFIEVIKDSLTIFKVQTDGGTLSQFQHDNDQLYRWICMNNPNEKLDKAIDNFTKSCAAFCVATFILGIGDRHPDNIMIKRDGKLFHIDFGHFLGHFKTKFGIKRERVPFVLTEDFTKVISRGSQNPTNTQEFKKFRTLCVQAYMIIRRYSYFIINLFTLMLSSDMPELQSNEDILYLRNQLAIDETDDRAKKFFSDQFDRVLKFGFSTKIDWVFHAINKNNRI